VSPACISLAFVVVSMVCVPASAQTAVAIQPPNLAGEVAGALPGTAGVSASGAATFSVPIKLPPGSAGMAPVLALQYGSQGGEGLLGLGWSISGLVTTGTAAGTYDGTLSASPSPAGSVASQALSLSVAAPAPAMSASPNPLDLGTVGKGRLSAIKSITVSNTGTAGGNLAVGGSCTLNVRYLGSCSGGTDFAVVRLSGAGWVAIDVTVTGATSSAGNCN